MPTKTVEGRSPFRHHWLLEEGVAYLNHGSFGACPRPVLEAQSRLREALERNPMRFLARELEGRLDAARTELASFLGADPEGLSFVSNATQGLNTFLRAFPLGPGDEVLVTDHEYNASRNALEAVAKAAGATLVVAHVPWPLASAETFLEAVLAQRHAPDPARAVRSRDQPDRAGAPPRAADPGARPARRGDR